MNKRGFVLMDGLLALLILSTLAGLTISCFRLASGYERGFADYRRNSEAYYQDVFGEIGGCECRQGAL